MSLEVLDESMFQQKLEQVRKQPSEKDRARLIKNLCDNFEMSAEQGVAFVNECHDFESKMNAALVVYKVVADQEGFVELGKTKLFRYEEDKKEFCEKLGVEYVVDEKARRESGVKVNKFDKQSVSGYSTH